jgi:hypothetical protein
MSNQSFEVGVEKVQEFLLLGQIDKHIIAVDGLRDIV